MNFAELFSTPQGIAAQCVGFVAMGVAFFIFVFRDRKKILFTKMIADVLWVMHYGLLSAFSGAFINAVNAVREGIFYHKGKPWANHFLWPIGFVLVNLILTFFSWQGFVSLLPVFGSSINILGLWCNDPKRIRQISLPAQTLWEIYSILVGSIPSIIFNAISICSILFAMARDFLEKGHEKN